MSGSTPGRRRAVRLLPYLLLAPALLVELLVHVLPMLAGAVMSLLRLNQFAIRDLTRAPAAGLDNYRLAADLTGPVGADLLRSFGITLAFSLLAVSGAFLLGLAGAVAMRKAFRGRGLLRTLLLIPFALPVFSSVITWNFMLQRDTGLVNTVLVDWLGLTEDRLFWLVGPNSFASLVVVAVWRTWPFAFLTITAGLQSIPAELYEAADLDGAGPWRRLFAVTLPLLRPVTTVLVLVLFLWSCNDFTTPFTLFGAAAPAEADVVSLHIYQSSFVTWNFGLGSAMSMLMLGFLLLVTIGYLALTGRRRRDG
ncbi:MULTISPECIES: carbohydrate ABC transporter permease [unclassified Crossiella]|uniref:carbohydrate ABC transporter permease n=1 Tax=unclassified Crossiella TaxID=2620835 RepID=UPI001FFF3FD2|nr:MULTISPECIES: sugar ABC transporter permease [unclassified Crossiella]MCK2241519.1 sugar ABC transporter permease [Crossiella sp. S99.2]MCK2255609.1 sugar ABC transporter permease [Crossiella sp. S99.1]